MILSINILAGVSQQSSHIPPKLSLRAASARPREATPTQLPYSAAYREGTVSIKPAAYGPSVAREEDERGNRTNELMCRPASLINLSE